MMVGYAYSASALPIHCIALHGSCNLVLLSEVGVALRGWLNEKLKRLLVIHVSSMRGWIISIIDMM